MRYAGKHFIAQLIPPRTFSRVVGKRRDPCSTIFDEVYWQAFYCAVQSSSCVFSGCWLLASNVIPAVRFLMRSAGKHFIAQLIPPHTFSWAVGKRCDPRSTIFDE
ncbi:hypothetical protein PanWU01x14_288230, partial [Parasponia andersonii]